MIPLSAFQVLVDVITGARAQATKEHMEFMEFYKALVNIVDEQTAKEFGNVEVPTRIKGKVEQGYRLEINSTDLLWWQSLIVNDNGRFEAGASAVQRAIWSRLNTMAKRGALTAEQKALILDLTFDNV